MFEFENTTLWCKSLGRHNKDPDEHARDHLRTTLLRLRDRAAILVNTIQGEIPGLTVHDITHIDALWETASLIAGDSFPLTPAESFVLGGAICLHDAAHCLAAYPGGLSDIKRTLEWRDSVAIELQRREHSSITQEMIENPPDDVIMEALPNALRSLHAKQADRLALISWPGAEISEPEEYLIADPELRSYYGPLIGKIAASHWWNVSALMQLPPTYNAGPNLPFTWVVDPIKVACLLRVADAAHIDQRRAPRWSRTINRPKGESEKHWQFQERLGKPSRQQDGIVYTAEPFGLNAVAAWWLCYDIVCMIDKELKAVDSLLEETQRQRFLINHVKGVASPQSLSQFIATEGWTPVDTTLKASDVAFLVANIGGKNLYGNRPEIALRELLQNAADAIRARRCLQGKKQNYGLIVVSCTSRASEVWLEVEDNGIGMGASVITNALLDFGVSLWRSNNLQREHPGLLGRGFLPTGRFGLGFFSVFILGHYVKVTSRRYDAALSDEKVLEFVEGLASRPLLRAPVEDESLGDPGTRVSVRIDSKVLKRLLENTVTQDQNTLAQVVAHLCPTLDVTVKVKELSGEEQIAVEANDWLSAASEELLARSQTIIRSIPFTDPNNLRVLLDAEGHCYGRAALSMECGLTAAAGGVVTIGGFRSTDIVAPGISGFLVASKPVTVLRDEAIPDVPLEVLGNWASEQARILAEYDFDSWVHARKEWLFKDDVPKRKRIRDKVTTESAGVVLVCGGTVGDLPFAWIGNRCANTTELRQFMEERETVMVCGEDVVINRLHAGSLDAVDGVVYARSNVRFFLFLREAGGLWPSCLPGYEDLKGARSPFDLVCSVIKADWGQESVERGFTKSLCVGSENSGEVIEDVIVISRTKSN